MTLMTLFLICVSWNLGSCHSSSSVTRWWTLVFNDCLVDDEPRVSISHLKQNMLNSVSQTGFVWQNLLHFVSEWINFMWCHKWRVWVSVSSTNKYDLTISVENYLILSCKSISPMISPVELACLAYISDLCSPQCVDCAVQSWHQT